jgi:hypothetical protein
MTEVRDRLREQPLPGEAEAAARAWPVVEAALSARESEGAAPGRRMPSRRAGARLVLAAALVGAGVLAALTPAGAEVGDWIGDRFASEGGPARPAFAALPEGGSVLALSRTGAYAVHPDGSSSWLGPFSEAGWSPRGLHVVGVDGRRLVAVTPDGTPRWTLARRRQVHHPAWSLGEGFVVAYLEGRAGLRAVGGNGDPATDRMLRRDARPVTPAWRPRARYLVTYSTSSGFVETLDAISGESVWRAEPDAGDVLALAWSRDGSRLAALSSRSVTVLGRSGRVLRTIPLPGAGRELALHPSGRRAAVLVTSRGQRRVLELPLAGGKASQLFQGDVDGMSWSADGRHLLLAWRDTGEWLLLGPGGRMRALNDVSAELGSAGGFPRVAGWCCPG